MNFSAAKCSREVAHKSFVPRAEIRPNGALIILETPSIKKQMVREGADAAGGTTAGVRQFVQSEYEKWKLIVRELGATPERPSISQPPGQERPSGHEAATS